MEAVTLPTLWINEINQIPLFMLDASGNAVTGIAYNQVTVKYTRAADVDMQTFSVTSPDWSERGNGLYALSMPGSVFNQEGMFGLFVQPPSTPHYRGFGAIDRRPEDRIWNTPVTGYASPMAGKNLYDASQQTFQVFGNPQYDYANQRIDFTCWMHQNGQRITSPTSCTVTIKETNGGATVFSGSSSSPSAAGFFYISGSPIVLAPNKNYSIAVEIVYNGTTYSSNDAAQSLN